MGNMAGKVALVTGGATGIGFAAASRLSHEGAKVAIFGRRQDKLDLAADAVRANGGEVVTRQVDVGDTAAYVRAINAVADAHGRLDALVNNAMHDVMGPVIDMPLEVWRDAFRINADAVFVSVQEAFKLMPKNGGGSVVNISTTCAIKALENTAAYGASKAALQHFSAIAAMEGAAYNVRVNCIIPGWVATDASTAFAAGDEALLASIGNSIPMGRMGRPDELAAAILFLCSDESSYVNGAALPVDGGHYMRINTPG